MKIPSKQPRSMIPGDEAAARVENLFRRARLDHSVIFELENELDRLGMFTRYQDRFLELLEQDAP